MKFASMCSGYEGFGLALGAAPIWVAEYEAAPSKVLEHHYPDVPNLGDITTANWSRVEPVDLICAGFPCQPFSHAGLRKGTTDDRHIWPHIADAVRVLRPRHLFLENVAGLLTLGMGDVLGDLAALGFDAEWCCVRASDVGACHRRERVFILATNTDSCPGPEPDGRANEPRFDTPRRDDTERLGATAWGDYGPAVARWEHTLRRPAPTPTDTKGRLSPRFVEWMMGLPAGWVTDVPDLTRTAQLKMLGNGIVPAQARHAYQLLAHTNKAAA